MLLSLDSPFPFYCSFANWCHKTLRICDLLCGFLMQNEPKNLQICDFRTWKQISLSTCRDSQKAFTSHLSLFVISWSFPCYYLSTLRFLFIAVLPIGVTKILGFAIYFADFQCGMNPRICKFAIFGLENNLAWPRLEILKSPWLDLSLFVISRTFPCHYLSTLPPHNLLTCTFMYPHSSTHVQHI